MLSGSVLYCTLAASDWSFVVGSDRYSDSDSVLQCTLLQCNFIDRSFVVVLPPGARGLGRNNQHTAKQTEQSGVASVAVVTE